MEPKAEILAFHGWGFDRNAWSAWQPYLAPFYRLQAFDRGYYGRPYDPVFNDPNSRKIIFAHSYGLQLCPRQQLELCDLLVMFNGFIWFHPEAPRLQKKSRLILQRMQARFAIEPAAVIRDFMQRCYAPVDYEGSLSMEYDSHLLAEDLRLLDHRGISIDALKSIRHVHILHGTEDRIVPNRQGRMLFEKLRQQGRYHEIEGAGHGLPFSHTQQCWSILEPVLRNL